MKRLLGQSTLVVVLSLLALMSILVGLVPRAAQALAAGTSVCGSIYVNTTWTVISSPYQVCNTSGVSVGPTATLTIQPGVTITETINDTAAAVRSTSRRLGASLGTADGEGRGVAAGSHAVAAIASAKNRISVLCIRPSCLQE